MFGIFLDNAVKYSTEGSEIYVSLKRKDRKIIYEITNEMDQIKKEIRMYCLSVSIAVTHREIPQREGAV